MFGSAGADLMDGGDGRDLLLYFGALTLDMEAPANNTGQALGDTLIGIERVEFAGPGVVRYVGGSGAMTVSTGGTAVLAVAGTGAEAFIMRVGSMAVSYAKTAAEGVTFTVVSNPLSGVRGALGDQLVGVGSVTLTARNDGFDLTGFLGFNPDPTVVNAGGGDDSLTLAQSVTSTIDAGNGNDTLTGRMDDGSLTLGAGNDRVDLAVQGSGVVTKPHVVSAGAGADDITVVTIRAQLTVTGGAGDDKIDLSDMLQSGTYTVDGGAGNDTVAGFDDGRDLIRFEGTAGVGLDSFDDLTVTDNATQTLVTFDTDTILLQGLDVANFTAADVLFS